MTKEILRTTDGKACKDHDVVISFNGRLLVVSSGPSQNFARLSYNTRQTMAVRAPSAVHELGMSYSYLIDPMI